MFSIMCRALLLLTASFAPFPFFPLACFNLWCATCDVQVWLLG